tara:strand:- start:535 stop:2529 length:1995 start_codon:yes stop_codon:yes gene_type:complete
MRGFGESRNDKKLYQKLVPPSIEEIINIAIKLQLRGNINEASKYYRYCIDNGINDPRILCNYGLILRELGDLENAQLMMEKSIRMSSNDTLTHNNLSGILQELGKYNEAEDILNKCLEIDQQNPITYNNLGIILTCQGKLDKAEIIFKKALSINHNDENAYLNLGSLMRTLGNTKEAIEYTLKAIDIKPNNPASYCNLGDFYKISGDYSKAIINYKKVLNLNKNYTSAKCGLVNCKGLICDWNNHDIDDHWINELGIKGEPVDPYVFFLYDDNPINNLKRSKRYARKNFKRVEMAKFETQENKKIRIGYFSADFKDHPVTHMLLSFFELHDKNKFEIFLYSFTITEDIYTNRLKNLGFKFKNIKDLNELEIFKLVRSDKLNIAIDLMGYTDKNRAIIFSRRLAPIQINYLGFPGTMGSKSYDYILGDKIIIPKKDERFYTEKVLRLKHFFPPNRCAREISKENSLLRKDFNIPNNAFVFTCFNNNKKITRKEFDLWMQLLHEITDGILWLSKSNNLAKINLKKEAEKRNIDPERIIFAERLETKGHHLARYNISDLGLDTFNYNGHTTTSDALWSGLPVLTKIGKSFASRVSASILHSLELDELVAITEKEYEEKALFLAQNRYEISKLKLKLKGIRDKNLLQSENYVRDLENLYMKIIKRRPI